MEETPIFSISYKQKDFDKMSITISLTQLKLYIESML